MSQIGSKSSSTVRLSEADADANADVNADASNPEEDGRMEVPEHDPELLKKPAFLLTAEEKRLKQAVINAQNYNWLRKRADEYNRSPGYINIEDGINCPICNNRGMIEEVVECGDAKSGYGYYTTAMKECVCKKRRRSEHLIRASGLQADLYKCTFDKFIIEDRWQERVVQTAKRFIEDYLNGTGKWLFFGGQSGAGKTYICTAVCGELLKKNISVKYMKWAKESTRLKPLVNTDSIDAELAAYCVEDVLYIDDFLKTPRKSGGAIPPTDADISLAYKLIDSRYTAGKAVILSSEWYSNEIIDFDEATFSRVIELCHGNLMDIKRDKSRNFRLKSVNVA